jgi:hypothetical protein
MSKYIKEKKNKFLNLRKIFGTTLGYVVIIFIL